MGDTKKNILKKAPEFHLKNGAGCYNPAEEIRPLYNFTPPPPTDITTMMMMMMMFHYSIMYVF